MIIAGYSVSLLNIFSLSSEDKIAANSPAVESVKFINIIWLLPLVFMLHDFEEIIFVEWWVNKNKEVLLKRFPRVAKMYSGLSTIAFALAVSEEYIILLLITLASVIFNIVDKLPHLVYDVKNKSEIR